MLKSKLGASFFYISRPVNIVTLTVGWQLDSYWFQLYIFLICYEEREIIKCIRIDDLMPYFAKLFVAVINSVQFDPSLKFSSWFTPL